MEYFYSSDYSVPIHGNEDERVTVLLTHNTDIMEEEVKRRSIREFADHETSDQSIIDRRDVCKKKKL